MSRLPRLRGRDVLKRLERFGFVVTRIRGSHHILRHPDGRSTVVPVHASGVIGPGLLRRILSDCGITIEEFENA